MKKSFTQNFYAKGSSRRILNSRAERVRPSRLMLDESISINSDLGSPMKMNKIKKKSGQRKKNRGLTYGFSPRNSVANSMRSKFKSIKNMDTISP